MSVILLQDTEVLEPNLLVKRKKPTGPIRLKKSKLTNDILRCWVFQPRLSIGHELVSNTAFTLAGGNILAPSKGAFFNGNGDYLSDNDAVSTSREAYTMFTLWEPNDVAKLDQYVMSARVGTSGDRYYLRNNGGVLEYGWSSQFNRLTGKNWTLNKPSAVSMAWDSIGGSIYVEGENTNNHSGNESNPSNFALAALSSLSTTTTWHAIGWAYIAVLWIRRLSHGENISMHNDPYQIVESI